jgi:ElaA protein
MSQSSQISWSLKQFNDLSVHELYAALQLRQAVFSVEQNCAYLDCDDKDQPSWHLSGYKDNVLIAYSRIIPAGVAYHEVSIGRVITHKHHRMTGAGKELMKLSIEHCERLFGHQPIRIAAQKYLKRFYEDFGFEDVGHEYLEDGILHLIMLRQ